MDVEDPERLFDLSTVFDGNDKIRTPTKVRKRIITASQPVLKESTIKFEVQKYVRYEEEKVDKDAIDLNFNIIKACGSLDQINGHSPCMPSLRLEMLEREYEEPVRDRDKDWILHSQRPIFNEKGKDIVDPQFEIKLGKYKKVETVSKPFWAKEYQTMLRECLLHRQAAIISDTNCIVEIYGVGFTGRLFTEGATSPKLLVVEAYSIWNSQKYMLVLTVMELRLLLVENPDLLKPGRRSDLIKFVMGALYFEYTITIPAREDPNHSKATTKPTATIDIVTPVEEIRSNLNKQNNTDDELSMSIENNMYLRADDTHEGDARREQLAAGGWHDSESNYGTADKLNNEHRLNNENQDNHAHGEKLKRRSSNARSPHPHSPHPHATKKERLEFKLHLQKELAHEHSHALSDAAVERILPVNTHHDPASHIAVHIDHTVPHMQIHFEDAPSHMSPRSKQHHQNHQQQHQDIHDGHATPRERGAGLGHRTSAAATATATPTAVMSPMHKLSADRKHSSAVSPHGSHSSHHKCRSTIEEKHNQHSTPISNHHDMEDKHKNNSNTHSNSSSADLVESNNENSNRMIKRWAEGKEENVIGKHSSAEHLSAGVVTDASGDISSIIADEIDLNREDRVLNTTIASALDPELQSMYLHSGEVNIRAVPTSPTLAPLVIPVGMQVGGDLVVVPETHSQRDNDKVMDDSANSAEPNTSTEGGELPLAEQQESNCGANEVECSAAASCNGSEETEGGLNSARKRLIYAAADEAFDPFSVAQIQTVVHLDPPTMPKGYPSTIEQMIRIPPVCPEGSHDPQPVVTQELHIGTYRRDNGPMLRKRQAIERRIAEEAEQARLRAIWLATPKHRRNLKGIRLIRKCNYMVLLTGYYDPLRPNTIMLIGMVSGEATRMSMYLGLGKIKEILHIDTPCHTWSSDELTEYVTAVLKYAGIYKTDSPQGYAIYVAKATGLEAELLIPHTVNETLMTIRSRRRPIVSAIWNNPDSTALHYTELLSTPTLHIPSSINFDENGEEHSRTVSDEISSVLPIPSAAVAVPATTVDFATTVEHSAEESFVDKESNKRIERSAAENVDTEHTGEALMEMEDQMQITEEKPGCAEEEALKNNMNIPSAAAGPISQEDSNKTKNALEESTESSLAKQGSQDVAKITATITTTTTAAHATTAKPITSSLSSLPAVSRRPGWTSLGANHSSRDVGATLGSTLKPYREIGKPRRLTSRAVRVEHIRCIYALYANTHNMINYKKNIPKWPVRDPNAPKAVVVNEEEDKEETQANSDDDDDFLKTKSESDDDDDDDDEDDEDGNDLGGKKAHNNKKKKKNNKKKTKLNRKGSKIDPDELLNDESDELNDADMKNDVYATFAEGLILELMVYIPTSSVFQDLEIPSSGSLSMKFTVDDLDPIFTTQSDKERIVRALRAVYRSFFENAPGDEVRQAECDWDWFGCKLMSKARWAVRGGLSSRIATAISDLQHSQLGNDILQEMFSSEERLQYIQTLLYSNATPVESAPSEPQNLFSEGPSMKYMGSTASLVLPESLTQSRENNSNKEETLVVDDVAPHVTLTWPCTVWSKAMKVRCSIPQRGEFIRMQVVVYQKGQSLGVIAFDREKGEIYFAQHFDSALQLNQIQSFRFISSSERSLQLYLFLSAGLVYTESVCQDGVTRGKITFGAVDEGDAVLDSADVIEGDYAAATEALLNSATNKAQARMKRKK